MADDSKDSRPDIPRLRGLLEPDGSNPFTDRKPAEDDPSATQELPYQPGDFETRVAHRGWRILFAGLFGFGVALPAPFSGGLQIGLVAAALVCGGYAWYAGRNDLKAIEAGVMDKAGERLTRVGHALGVVAVCLAIGGLVFQIGSTIYLLVRNGVI